MDRYGDRTHSPIVDTSRVIQDISRPQRSAEAEYAHGCG
jgi:hypothetical protein